MADQLHVPDFTRTYTVAQGALKKYSPGDVYASADGSRKFRYVKMTAAAAVAGHMLGFSTAGDRKTVINGTASTPAAGLAIVAIAQDSYGWVQCRGRNLATVITDGNVTQGLMCSIDAGEAVEPEIDADNLSEFRAGVALATDTGTVLAIGEFELLCDDQPRGDFIA